MNYGADAADQVVRYSMDGIEHSLRISGAIAKNLAVFIVAVLKDQKKTRGKTRMVRMLKERKPMKFFTVPDDKLKLFAREAKSRGLLYVVVKDKNKKINNEIMVFAEDAAKMNRVLDQIGIDYVQSECGKAEFEPMKEKDAQTQEMQSGEKSSTEHTKEQASGKSSEAEAKTQTVELSDGKIEFEVGEGENIFEIGEVGGGNFMQAQGERNLSGTSSRSRRSSSVEVNDRGEPRSSVRKELNEIKKDQAKNRKKSAQRQKNRQHTQTRKRRKVKGKGR